MYAFEVAHGVPNITCFTLDHFHCGYRNQNIHILIKGKKVNPEVLGDVEQARECR